MKSKSILTIVIIALLVALLPSHIIAQENSKSRSKLAVLWTSGDPDVAHRVAFMYSHTAKKVGWFDEVTLIVWGPSQRILIGDKDLQAKVKAAPCRRLTGRSIRNEE